MSDQLPVRLLVTGIQGRVWISWWWFGAILRNHVHLRVILAELLMRGRHATTVAAIAVGWRYPFFVHKTLSLVYIGRWVTQGVTVIIYHESIDLLI